VRQNINFVYYLCRSSTLLINWFRFIYVGGAVKKSIKKSLRRLLPGGRRSSDHVHQSGRDHVTSDPSHSARKNHMTKEHVATDSTQYGGQDDEISEHVTTDHPHQNHVIAHVISDHAHCDSSTSNATLDDAENVEGGQALSTILDDATIIHVTADHAHQGDIKEPANSNQLINQNLEASLLQSAHVDAIRSEV